MGESGLETNPVDDEKMLLTEPVLPEPMLHEDRLMASPIRAESGKNVFIMQMFFVS